MRVVFAPSAAAALHLASRWIIGIYPVPEDDAVVATSSQIGEVLGHDLYRNATLFRWSTPLDPHDSIAPAAIFIRGTGPSVVATALLLRPRRGNNDILLIEENGQRVPIALPAPAVATATASVPIAQRPRRRRSVVTVEEPTLVHADEGVTVTGQLVYTRDDLERIAQEEAERVGLDPALVAGVITVESNWHTEARSSAGAMGLMQIMPRVWTSVGHGDDPYDPQENIRAGCELLARLSTRFHDRGITYILACYRSGSGNVSRRGVNADDESYATRVMHWRSTFTERFQ